jgi:hypothetical protein
MEVAIAIQEHVGSGDCDEHQLSAWLKKSQKSSGFRSVWSTARLFGLIETENGKFRLSPLGRRAVDPAQERDAKAKAFLTVPLYNKLFENYKGVALPPSAALERELVQIGVAEKQKHTARLVLERSALYAGFFEHGKDRLVMPGVVPDERRELPKPNESEGRPGGGAGGSGGGEKPRHPFIEGLLKTLPDPDSDEESRSSQRRPSVRLARTTRREKMSGGGSSGSGDGAAPPRHPLIEGMFQSLPENGKPWTLDEAADWLHAAAYNLRFAYKLKGKITIDIKIEKPSETP